ncbi:MAG TPA: serine/threonine-protein kinase [Polyangiaceae bacterium]|nr:serine/threonine-protein kinase [Polyangiaceae bacterium]
MGELREAPLLAQGRTIAHRYELCHELGRGGMGLVWAARDRLRDQSVAIKLQLDTTIDGAAARRFEREVDALRRVSSAHVVRIFDAGRDQGLSYIVMERLRGETLKERLAKGGAFSARERCAIVAQAAAGLAAAHALGVVHRDIKPSNLFLSHEGSVEAVKVIDFGIAKASIELMGDATGSGIIGSPTHMSPEQARGQHVDARSDLWALAAVAFELSYGREPFTERELPATLQRICAGKAHRVSGTRGAVPAALGPFFKRAFLVDSRQRFQTAEELAACFEQAWCSAASELPGRSDDTKTLAPGVVTLRRPKLAPAFTALTLALGGAAVLAANGSAARPEVPRLLLASRAEAAARQPSAPLRLEPLGAPGGHAVALTRAVVARPKPAADRGFALTREGRAARQPRVPIPTPPTVDETAASSQREPPPAAVAVAPEADPLDRRF